MKITNAPKGSFRSAFIHGWLAFAVSLLVALILYAIGLEQAAQAAAKFPIFIGITAFWREWRSTSPAAP